MATHTQARHTESVSLTFLTGTEWHRKERREEEKGEDRRKERRKERKGEEEGEEKGEEEGEEEGKERRGSQEERGGKRGPNQSLSPVDRMSPLYPRMTHFDFSHETKTRKTTIKKTH